MPLILISLCLDLWPFTTTTCDLDISSRLARNSTQSRFAASSTGGAVSRTFNSPPCMPHISLRLALGWTWMVKVTPSLVSLQTRVDAFSLAFIEVKHLVVGIEEGFERCGKLEFFPAQLLNLGINLCQAAFCIRNNTFGL